MPANAPLPVVGFLEGQERQPKSLDRVEATDPEKIFLEGASKALGNTGANSAAGSGDNHRFMCEISLHIFHPL